MDDNAADVLSIHKVLIALINFVTPGPASTTTPAPLAGLGRVQLHLVFVSVLMASRCPAVVIIDFISRASRRAKCHISSSVGREKRL